MRGKQVNTLSWLTSLLSHPHPYGYGYVSFFLTRKNAQQHTLGWVRHTGQVTLPLAAESPVTSTLEEQLHIRPLLFDIWVNFSLVVSILWWQAAIWWKSRKEYRCSARILFLSPIPPFLSLSAIPLRLQTNLSLCTPQTGDAIWRRSTRVYNNSLQLSLYLGHLSVVLERWS